MELKNLQALVHRGWGAGEKEPILIGAFEYRHAADVFCEAYIAKDQPPETFLIRTDLYNGNQKIFRKERAGQSLDPEGKGPARSPDDVL